VGQFGLVALAALAITGEFATGSIRTTLAATPARWAVLTAKAAVVGAVLFAPPNLGVLGALVSNEVVATVMDYLPAGDCLHRRDP
jgi:ABC-2 type transport system permease protein